MCGIFGLIGTPWRESAGPALDTLRTRGPDDSALLDLGDAILGHTRLAVIDLVSGQQPMRSADGRYTIVFNGEIYNFRELRKQLAGAGHAFITQSDTEVLLQGFAAWGDRLVPRLDGHQAVLLFHRGRFLVRVHARAVSAARRVPPPDRLPGTARLPCQPDGAGTAFFPERRAAALARLAACVERARRKARDQALLGHTGPERCRVRPHGIARSRRWRDRRQRARAARRRCAARRVSLRGNRFEPHGPLQC